MEEKDLKKIFDKQLRAERVKVLEEKEKELKKEVNDIFTNKLEKVVMTYKEKLMYKVNEKEMFFLQYELETTFSFYIFSIICDTYLNVLYVDSEISDIIKGNVNKLLKRDRLLIILEV